MFKLSLFVAVAASLIHEVVAIPPTRVLEPREPQHTFHPKPAGAYPSPEPCHGNCTTLNDNSIIRRRSDGTIFRFGELNGNIYAWTAQNLTANWTSVPGTFLPNRPGAHYRNRTWAPDVHYYNGLYYLFFTVPGIDVIRYATSQTLELDSWNEHGALAIPRSSQYNQIGPGFYPDSDPPFLAFGSDSVGIFGVNLTQPPYSVLPNQTAQKLIHDERVPALPSSQKHNLTEGAYQYQYGNYHYIFFSRGQCCLSKKVFQTQYQRFYRIEVCRASSPWATYYNRNGEACDNRGRGTVVLEGHGDIIATGSCGVHNDKYEGEILHYQYLNLSNTHKTFNRKSYKFGYNHLSFATGWPRVVSKEEKMAEMQAKKKARRSEPDSL